MTEEDVVGWPQRVGYGTVGFGQLCLAGGSAIERRALGMPLATRKGP